VQVIAVVDLAKESCATMVSKHGDEWREVALGDEKMSTRSIQYVSNRFSIYSYTLQEHDDEMARALVIYKCFNLPFPRPQLVTMIMVPK
jgi:hypothetical protein